MTGRSVVLAHAHMIKVMGFCVATERRFADFAGINRK